MLLINCEINLILTCVLSNATNATFATADTKLCVPFVTLST